MLLLLPLLPLRVVVGGGAVCMVAVINSIAAWNWPVDKPLTPWRRQLVLLSKELMLVTLWCLGFRIRVKGREYIKMGERCRAVGIFNHVSWVDAFVMVWLMAPSGVSKASNADLPVLKHAIRALQTVYIPYEKLSRRAATSAPPAPDRSRSRSPTPAPGAAGSSSDSDEATQSLNGNGLLPDASTGSITNMQNGVSGGAGVGGATAAAAAAAAAVAAVAAVSDAAGMPSSANAPALGGPVHGRGRRALIVSGNVTDVLLRRVNDPSYCRPGGYPMIAMAPEGTTGNGRGLLKFRTGAFVLGRPVLPICLRYRGRALNPGWTIVDERWHFLRLMCQFRNDLEIEILPPYLPSQDELKDPKLFSANVRRLMAAVLGVPLVDASHDDYLLLRRAGVETSWDGRRVLLPQRTVAALGALGRLPPSGRMADVEVAALAAADAAARKGE